MVFGRQDNQPFGEFRNFADCVAKQKKSGKPEGEALSFCDSLQTKASGGKEDTEAKVVK